MPLTASPRALKRLHNLIWTLILAGLLVAVLGVATLRQPGADDTGSLLLTGGAAAAALGFLLIWVRSRLRESD